MSLSSTSLRRRRTTDEQGALGQAATWVGADLSPHLLGGVIDYAFNPAYPDGSDDACMFDAVLKAMRFIEDQPCVCDDDGDPCERCDALGRYKNERQER